jgi:hypothetical protein
MIRKTGASVAILTLALGVAGVVAQTTIYMLRLD